MQMSVADRAARCYNRKVRKRPSELLFALKISMSTEPTQPEDFVSLYRRAFTEYGTHALWNKRFLETPTFEDALVVARALRIEGDRGARRLADQIEQACRAAI
jgi:hypothetical protein